MVTIAIIGAGGIGMHLAEHLAQRECLPIIHYCPGPGGCTDRYAEVVVPPLADYSLQEFRDAFEFKYDFAPSPQESAAVNIILEARKIAFKEEPPAHLVPPRFNGYMKRTHRRRM
ncbi:MAG: hypothetical protein JWP58_3287 [Hymenobacter sp.]|nr:hypothetical protein [Hymenobacter sp.]